MTPDAYAAFTAALRGRLESDPRVLALVALGSMARRDYEPDRWSDHDFFVITRSGEQESFRTDLAWLPDSASIVFSFRETAHGVKALFADGHLVEFAVFDSDELRLARVNRYRVLFDRADVGSRLAELATLSAQESEPARTDDAWLLGQFLTSLLVGVGRYNRGERQSGRLLVRSNAQRHLLILLARHVPSPRKALLDNLDPFRRFEAVFPDLGREIDGILARETPAAASGLLRLAERELAQRLPNFPFRAVAVVARLIASVG